MLISLKPLVGSLEEYSLAVKLLDNPLYMSPISHMKQIFNFKIFKFKTDLNISLM